ncbi:MAG: polyphosphate polymerase domain-containing protein [Oscillospiraceae bacterium]|nr:polyphosphate polymerase domain-containing protein [Oscillospiraceae bacterium]
MDYRVENKYLVSDTELYVIGHRLRPFMAFDRNQQGDSYEIRSIYFDDIRDSCLEENDAGVDARLKYRIRSYGPDFDFLRLEIKEKLNGYTRKYSCPISMAEFEAIMQGGDSLGFGQRSPLNRLLLHMRCDMLRPRLIVKYERSAFIHPSGNVRVTFDRNISASLRLDEFFSPAVSACVPVLPRNMHVLEVKYDELLPDTVAAQLETGRLQKSAFSKYYLGRLAVNNQFLL